MRIFIIEKREAPSSAGPWSEPEEISRTLDATHELTETDWTEPRRHTHKGKPYWAQRRGRIVDDDGKPVESVEAQLRQRIFDLEQRVEELEARAVSSETVGHLARYLENRERAFAAMQAGQSSVAVSHDIECQNARYEFDGGCFRELKPAAKSLLAAANEAEG